MQIAFPYVFDQSRLTGLTDDKSHLRQMLEQLLFTMPGERVNRPDFGCAVQRLVFGTQSTEVVATVQRLIESEIQRWLGDVLILRNLEITADDAILKILVEYQPQSGGTVVAERFERGG